jgi:hypothetical protein
MHKQPVRQVLQAVLRACHMASAGLRAPYRRTLHDTGLAVAAARHMDGPHVCAASVEQMVCASRCREQQNHCDGVNRRSRRSDKGKRPTAKQAANAINFRCGRRGMKACARL